MVTLTGHSLTLADINDVLYQNRRVMVSAESLERVDASRRAVEGIVEQEKVVYGITTGFGKFSDVLIKREDTEELQLNLIHSHACGMGETFPEMVSRAMLLRANTLLKGFSRVRRVVVETLVKLLNARIHPVVPGQGSLGASGDGYGPFRWVCLSGKDEDLRKTDLAAMSCIDPGRRGQDRDNYIWIRDAEKNRLVVNGRGLGGGVRPPHLSLRKGGDHPGPGEPGQHQKR